MDCDEETVFEVERFPKDEFQNVNVKQVPMGFHTMAWTDDEFEEWESERAS